MIRFILAIVSFFIIVSPHAQIRASDRWAIVHISVANIRTEPRHSAELSTQATMGTPLQITEILDNGWYKISMPDGYTGYIIGNSITQKSSDEIAEWKKSERLIVSSFNEIKAYKDSVGQEVISDLVNGNIVQYIESSNKRHKIALPDGRIGWVYRYNVMPIRQWASQPFNPNLIIDMAKSLIGTPYLWGGTSTKGVDCSGLSKITYFANGIILLRDSSQQSECGKLSASPQKGDLLFFGNKATGRINHVGIYDCDGYYIESSGRVKRSNISNANNYMFTRHLSQSIGTNGIIRAINHPWYF